MEYFLIVPLTGVIVWALHTISSDREARKARLKREIERRINTVNRW